MPLYEEKFICPLSIRFSQARIRPTFQDGRVVERSMQQVEAVPFAPEQPGSSEYDAYLNAPFPPIEIIRWSPKIRNQDGTTCVDEDGRVLMAEACWFTFDNRRLYCLQAAAARYWPQRSAAIVHVMHDLPLSRGTPKKFRTTDLGCSVRISRRHDVVPRAIWSWAEAACCDGYMTKAQLGMAAEADESGEEGEEGEAARAPRAPEPEREPQEPPPPIKFALDAVFHDAAKEEWEQLVDVPPDALQGGAANPVLAVTPASHVAYQQQRAVERDQREYPDHAERVRRRQERLAQEREKAAEASAAAAATATGKERGGGEEQAPAAVSPAVPRATGSRANSTASTIAPSTQQPQPVAAAAKTPAPAPAPAPARTAGSAGAAPGAGSAAGKLGINGVNGSNRGPGLGIFNDVPKWTPQMAAGPSAFSGAETTLNGKPQSAGRSVGDRGLGLGGSSYTAGDGLSLAAARGGPGIGSGLLGSGIAGPSSGLGSSGAPTSNLNPFAKSFILPGAENPPLPSWAPAARGLGQASLLVPNGHGSGGGSVAAGNAVGVPNKLASGEEDDDNCLQQ
jgi:hypothetical protein